MNETILQSLKAVLTVSARQSSSFSMNLNDFRVFDQAFTNLVKLGEDLENGSLEIVTPTPREASHEDYVADPAEGVLGGDRESD